MIPAHMLLKLTQAERESIGHNLSLLLLKYRVEHGLTQTELGRKLGVDVSTVSLWENQMVTPKWRRVRKLSSLLGVSPGLLTEGHLSNEQVRAIALSWRSRPLRRRSARQSA